MRALAKRMGHHTREGDDRAAATGTLHRMRQQRKSWGREKVGGARGKRGIGGEGYERGDERPPMIVLW